MDSNSYTVKYGSIDIPFSLKFSDRKTLAIHVYPDLSVCAVAPKSTSFKEICTIIKKRGSWILKKKRYFETFRPPVTPRMYVSGETHRYLGKQFRLKVLIGESKPAKLRKGRFIVYTNGINKSEQVMILLNQWYTKQANKVISEGLQRCIKNFERYEIKKKPRVFLRKMKSRWGSCSNTGRINLNTDLVKVPKRYIDYVITHELCHLKEPNHSPRFYRLLRSVMPDWEERREKLNWYGSK